MKKHKVSSHFSSFQVSDSELDPASRTSPHPPISPPAPDLSAFFLGSGLLTHGGSPGLHAEPQSDGQQRLALHPAPRAGRSAQDSGAGSFSPGLPREGGAEVERAPQRKTVGLKGEGALAPATACRGVCGCREKRKSPLRDSSGLSVARK